MESRRRRSSQTLTSATGALSRTTPPSTRRGIDFRSMLPALLLVCFFLAQPAFGRKHREAPSSCVHESNGAALTLLAKQQESQEEEEQQQQPDQALEFLDYVPLEFPSSLIRRRLSGPGSSPPQCTSKCGRCYPCRPVHVPIQPGLVKTAEYYPEAWRCKCGNKLFMP